ncbi:putative DNA primase/helicase [Nitrosomonas oligotropha]|uniref:Putative DNA primase/helicase n=2 Tax=Nitrosomonas oligotropha TaxID=42354 RepID=A0A2T5I3M4_9PROT|nr:putative DNA primase/helicase [Nitrosomonas oligotropha]
MILFLKSKRYASILPQEISDQFCRAMQSAGIRYSGEIIADGRLHRFHIEGQKQGSLNGAYTLHLDGCPAGWFMDYKTGLSKTWSSKSGFKVSYALIKQIEAAKQRRESETHQKHAETALKAEKIWQKSKSIDNQQAHPYLANKRVQPHGARKYHESLVIPIYNESDQIINLQFIDTKGGKRFLAGGRKRGCFYVIGDSTKRILICEGFATGASLFEDCGQRVVVAFDAGNLLPVAKKIRELSPDLEIIICGDNDISGIGQAKAKEAALAVGGKVLIPLTPGNDWNDELAGGIRHDA